MNTILFGLDIITFCAFLLVLVFSIGIVWRVEKKLDLAYKFFVAAAISLMLAEIVSFYYTEQIIQAIIWVKGLRLLGVIFFLVSILYMRDIVRRLDHEK